MPQVLPAHLREVVSPLVEAAKYERLRIRRGRGATNLALGLALTAFAWVGMASAWGPWTFGPGTLSAAASVALTRYQRTRFAKWGQIFSPAPAPRTLTEWAREMRAAPFAIVLVGGIALLAAVFIIGPATLTPAIDALLASAMILSYAIAAFQWGRSIGDAALVRLSILTAIGAGIVWQPGLASLAFAGAWCGLPS